MEDKTGDPMELKKRSANGEEAVRWDRWVWRGELAMASGGGGGLRMIGFGGLWIRGRAISCSISESDESLSEDESRISLARRDNRLLPGSGTG